MRATLEFGPNRLWIWGSGISCVTLVTIVVAVSKRRGSKERLPADTA